ncbi:uncharacterized protein LOC121765835 isoform X2 [Salvia splendens]|uniref:uncharacterized protein LOC121765835 isoform X2 n=1 Tax=Salvia splendens TaxID=180675 RepID=UPI001C2765A5|nr:uncharacterized protein LOC121765835 isoform X2 [Salvia splendens]
MNSWRNCNFRNQDEAALESVMQESGPPHRDDKDRPSETCIFGAENRKPKNGTILLIDEMLQLKESCSSYDENMEELQSYFDMVKRFTRPGCSAETLDVALNSISSLVDTLSAMSSKHHILHASL